MRLASLLLTLSLTVAASAQVGTLDPSFGDGGIVIDSLSEYDDVFSLVAQPGGSVLVVGLTKIQGNPSSQSAITVRYDASGARGAFRRHDTSSIPCPTRPEAFYDVIQEPDGTLVAVGFSQFACSGPVRDFWLLRLDETGGFVDNFERPGFYGQADFGRSLARQPDGRIVVGGAARAPNADYELAFTRYTTDGEIDLTFGTMGETVIDVGSDTDVPYGLAVAPDGTILAVGYAYDGSQYDIVLVRLTADGLPDPAFGSEGVIRIDEGTEDLAVDLSILADGRFLVTGYTADADGTSRAFVARYAADGTPDLTFGSGGRTALDFGGLSTYGGAHALQADGKIVVLAYTETTAGDRETRDFGLARLLPDGALDPSFGTGGMQTASWSAGAEFARDLVITSDGDLMVVGSVRETIEGVDYHDLALARFVGDTPPVANEQVPDGGLALSVSPNPTRGALAVRFDVREAGPVRLALYDTLGREVAVLTDGPRQPGEHETVFGGAELPAGVYLVRLEAGGEVRTRAVTIAR